MPRFPALILSAALASTSVSAHGQDTGCVGEGPTVYVADGFVVGGLLDGAPYFGLLLGSSGDDVIFATPDSDVVISFQGADLICAGNGNDLVFGGFGDDQMDGQDGVDIFVGGPGYDVCANVEIGFCEESVDDLSGDGPADDDHAEDSEGTVMLVGVTELAPNPLEVALQFLLDGETFSSDIDDFWLSINDELVSSELVQIGPTLVTVNVTLSDGKNDFFLHMLDSAGVGVNLGGTLWAGSSSLTVTLIDADGEAVPDVPVTVSLVDAPDVTLSSPTSSSGQAAFENLPHRTLLVTAIADDGRAAVRGIIGGDTTSLALQFPDLLAPSPIDNNDFSQGTAGWNGNKDSIEIVSHTEGALAALGEDLDLVLTTVGKGPVSVSRSFQVMPNTKNVVVRYRFITSEIPGGFFGTEYNDYFAVSVLSQQSGQVGLEASSMNALGSGAFSEIGATAWREISVPVTADKDVVQVEAEVANVGDGAFDSQLVIDFVAERQLTILQLALLDIDNGALEFLSAAPHSYFGGNTRLNGTISIQGDSDDSLVSVGLEVLQGGVVVATGTLSSSAQATLLQQPFGDAELLEITSPNLLFEVPTSQLAAISVQQNGTLRLRVTAHSNSGQTATQIFGRPLEILDLYPLANRFNPRDAGQGGDDWVLPSVRDVVAHFSSAFQVNDFSNMNGGAFAPHKSHRRGTDVDGWYQGYNARNAAVANTVLGWLNDPTFGSRIQVVFIKYDRVPSDSFWTTIQNFTLNDGRRARDVVLKDNGHDRHFHLRISP